MLAAERGLMTYIIISEYLVIINCRLPYLLWFAFGLGVAEAGYLRYLYINAESLLFLISKSLSCFENIKF